MKCRISRQKRQGLGLEEASAVLRENNSLGGYLVFLYRLLLSECIANLPRPGSILGKAENLNCSPVDPSSVSGRSLSDWFELLQTQGYKDGGRKFVPRQRCDK